MSKFTVHNNRGFQMTFANGLMVSVMFGTGNYCDNYMNTEKNSDGLTWSSNTAEVAVIEGRNFMDFESDQVKGYCDADEIATIINYTKHSTTLQDAGVKIREYFRDKPVF